MLISPAIMWWMVALLLPTSVLAAPLCSNLILETPEGAPLLRKFEKALKREIFPQVKKLRWKGQQLRVSVQNLPQHRQRIAPQYMIRLDLKPNVPGAAPTVLRNKTFQTPLRVDSYPTPDRKACDLVLQSRGDEYLVNQQDIPTPIYIPRISVRLRFPLAI